MRQGFIGDPTHSGVAVSPAVDSATCVAVGAQACRVVGMSGCFLLYLTSAQRKNGLLTHIRRVEAADSGSRLDSPVGQTNTGKKRALVLWHPEASVWCEERVSRASPERRWLVDARLHPTRVGDRLRSGGRPPRDLGCAALVRNAARGVPAGATPDGGTGHTSEAVAPYAGAEGDAGDAS
jgi:hypothetical protein